jgi:hypothetical protein
LKPALIAIVLLAFFTVCGCSSSRRSPAPQASATPSGQPFGQPSPAPPAATSPAEPPAPPPADPPPPAPAPEPARTLSLEDGMKKVDDAGLEDSLEAWAAGKELDFNHVIKRTGVFLDIAPKVKWDDNKKRERDPADHDRIMREAVEKATALVAAARASNADQVKELSELLIRRCTECHKKYK